MINMGNSNSFFLKKKLAPAIQVLDLINHENDWFGSIEDFYRSSK